MAQVAPQQQAPQPMQQPRDTVDSANQAGAANTTNTPTVSQERKNLTSRPGGSRDEKKPSIVKEPKGKGSDGDAASGGNAGGADSTTEKSDGETPSGGGAAPSNKSENKGQNRTRGNRGGRNSYRNKRQGGGNRSGNRQGNSNKNRSRSGSDSNESPRGGNTSGNRSQQQRNSYEPDKKSQRARILHVSAQSPVKQVAGAIAWISREGECPKILATAAPAINQAVKACAIARQFMSEDKIEVSVYPEYTRGRRRDADSFTFDLRKSVTRYQVVVDESMQELKVSKESKAPTVAGAIAGRVREGQRVILSAIGPLSVAAAVRSVAIARQYLAEDGVDISFRPSFMNIEFSDGRKSSCLNFQLLAQQV